MMSSYVYNEQAEV